MGSPIPLLRAYELPVEDGGGINSVRILATALVVLAACGYLFAAFACSRGRWWRFAAVLAGSLATSAMSQQLVSDLHL